MEDQISTNQSRVPLSWVDPHVVTQKVYNIDTESVATVCENARLNSELEQKTKSVGRPISLPDAYKYILERDGALKYAEVLANDALTAKRASDRREAIAEITDRTSGKAVQNVRHAGVFMVMAPGAEALAALDGWAEDE
jgi:hypothetical protein